jgi:hypothetical protein
MAANSGTHMMAARQSAPGPGLPPRQSNNIVRRTTKTSTVFSAQYGLPTISERRGSVDDPEGQQGITLLLNGVMSAEGRLRRLTSLLAGLAGDIVAAKQSQVSACQADLQMLSDQLHQLQFGIRQIREQPYVSRRQAAVHAASRALSKWEAHVGMLMESMKELQDPALRKSLAR